MQSALLISNAHAGSVSTRAQEVIVKALQADFKLEAEATESRDHATELARAAVDRGVDAVLAFGGDGTINEIAQTLVGTDVALGILPGGSTNVMARSLGVPRDPIEATAFVASNLRSGNTRRINVGRINGRYFLFSAGMGIDAEVVRRSEAQPEKKRMRGEWLFLSNALKTAITEYRGATPTITLTLGDEEPGRVLFVVCCNARPFTYFKGWPVDALPEARLDGGLDFLAFTRLRMATIPRVIYSLFISRSHIGWRTTRYAHDLRRAEVHADHPMPVQVDGDYIGRHDQAAFGLVEDALTLLV
jgi:diacylglycerol kinase family enzyme